MSQDSSDAFQRIANALESIRGLLQQQFDTQLRGIDFAKYRAGSYRKSNLNTWIDGVEMVSLIRLTDLLQIDVQKKRLFDNTHQFVLGKPFNHALLSGARGSGKSSLIHALLNEFDQQGLRLIEVDKADLTDLPRISSYLKNLPYRFIVFCDDLSFEANDPSYKALKSVLDGSIHRYSDNFVIYASSNRRHLLPETFADNQGYRMTEEAELHPGEAVEEKISLSERFGLWLSFYPFSQADYLMIVEHWLNKMGIHVDVYSKEEALRFALERGNRSGRIAYQFARDFASRSND